MTSFGIWCEVSGGVTGHRAAWLKRDGRVQLFADRGAAARMASDLMARTAGPYATASFRYTVREFTVGEFARC